MSQLDPAASVSSSTDRRSFALIGVISVAALGLLAWLLLYRQADSSGTLDLRFVPAVNAGFNALSTTLLTAGWFAIRSGRRTLHRNLMVSAFASSTLFLVGYLAYHYVHGDTKFQGTGTIRAVYLTILATHVLLSMVVVPGALTTFYFAFRKSFARHRKLARILLPIWLYVSVTGVVIYFMLHQMAPAAP